MTDAALNAGAFIDARWSNNGRKNFFLNYSAANYNEGFVVCHYPVVTDPFIGFNMKVTGISIRHVGTVGVRIRPWVEANQGGANYWLTQWVTARDPDQIHYNQLDIPMEQQVTDEEWIWLFIDGFIATDDVHLAVIGYAETAPVPLGPVDEPLPLPVSLEGYRWPLKRHGSI